MVLGTILYHRAVISDGGTNGFEVGARILDLFQGLGKKVLELLDSVDVQSAHMFIVVSISDLAIRSWERLVETGVFKVKIYLSSIICCDQ